MLYGNYSNGYSYSPDRRKEEVNRFSSSEPKYAMYNPLQDMNNRTFKANNGQYSNHYSYR